MTLWKWLRPGLFGIMGFCVGSTAIAQEQLQRQIDQLLHTTLGGYGVARYQRDQAAGNSSATLERFVLFAGHEFSRTLSLVSEVEFEDAKVEGGATGGEVAVEQAFLRYSWSPGDYVVAGLFIPRIGILNEHHLPAEYNGNERPFVETLLIPATWRELGVGVFGSLRNIPVQYSAGLMTGLDASRFEPLNAIREGRTEGFSPTANSAAVTASLQWTPGAVIVQVSGYAGGTLSIPGELADTLHLSTGLFSDPAFLGEADVRFTSDNWEGKALVCLVSIPDAGQLSSAFSQSIAERSTGGYVELGYNVAPSLGLDMGQRLVAFARYEGLDLNNMMPLAVMPDPDGRQSHVIAGLTYAPDPGVVIKGDVRFATIGDGAPTAKFFNLGLGFSF